MRTRVETLLRATPSVDLDGAARSPSTFPFRRLGLTIVESDGHFVQAKRGKSASRIPNPAGPCGSPCGTTSREDSVEGTFKPAPVAAEGSVRVLANVPLKEEVVLVRIDLAGDAAEPLLERGIVPGCRLCPLHYVPGDGPLVCSVDGSLVALRREMATCLCVRSAREAMGLLDAN